MGELVALHTQRLAEPVASAYLRQLGRALRGARLNKTFPDRKRLDATLRSLSAKTHCGLYDSIYVDSRAGLPNLASLTRVLADQGVGAEALGGYAAQAELDAKREEADVFARMANKRRYFEALRDVQLAPVDEHRVLLRRHEPEASRASFRVELTKLTGSGAYLRVVIELTQTSSVWSHKLVDLDTHGEVASGTEALRGMVYRFAAYDAETLFVRMHELEGVEVERVQRGIIGSVRFAIPSPTGPSYVLQPPSDAFDAVWADAGPEATDEPLLLTSFATDVAAKDVREEKSNDPLAPLLADGIEEKEQARYGILRQRHPFRVYKDRKFVVSPRLVEGTKAVCAAAGCRNLVYPLR